MFARRLASSIWRALFCLNRARHNVSTLRFLPLVFRRAAVLPFQCSAFLPLVLQPFFCYALTWPNRRKKESLPLGLESNGCFVMRPEAIQRPRARTDASCCRCCRQQKQQQCFRVALNLSFSAESPLFSALSLLGFALARRFKVKFSRQNSKSPFQRTQQCHLSARMASEFGSCPFYFYFAPPDCCWLANNLAEASDRQTGQSDRLGICVCICIPIGICRLATRGALSRIAPCGLRHWTQPRCELRAARCGSRWPIYPLIAPGGLPKPAR